MSEGDRSACRRRGEAVTTLIVWLLLGAIVNVAVAWGCAKTARLSASGYMTDPNEWAWLRDMGWKPLRDSGWITHHNRVRRYSGLGVEYIAYFEEERVKEGYFGSFIIGTASSAQVVKAGWPVRSLNGRGVDPAMLKRSNIRGAGLTFPAADELPFVENARGSVILLPHTKIWRDDLGPRLAPVMPIWPGFAINTAFYAVILWAIFAAPFALRRRRRIKRGLCPKCAYPMGTNERCTECGAAVPLSPRERAGVREAAT